MADLARQAGLSESSGGGAKDKAERDARIIGDFTDDLTVAIALKEFERAVQLVQDGGPPFRRLLGSENLPRFQERSKSDRSQASPRNSPL
jgi:hypothetical protein